MTTTTTAQTETISVTTAMGRMKKTALIATAVTGVAIAAFYGYQFYKKGKAIVDVVAEPAADDATVDTTEAVADAA